LRWEKRTKTGRVAGEAISKQALIEWETNMKEAKETITRITTTHQYS